MPIKINLKKHYDSSSFILEKLRYNKDTGEITRVMKSKSNLVSVVGSTARNHIWIRVNYKSIAAHRIAWFLHYGEWPNGIIDHIDRDGTNNRIENLRIISHRDNLKNSKRCESNFRGTQKHNKSDWCSILRINDKRYYIGSYPCRYQAAMAVICFENNEIPSLKGIYYRDL